MAKLVRSPVASHLKSFTDDAIIEYWLPIIARALASNKDKFSEQENSPVDYVVPILANGFLPTAYELSGKDVYLCKTPNYDIFV